jgi:hypothetical protein
VLDLNRVQMHVEFRREVRVQDCVYVFEVCSAGVLVEGVGFGVWSVEVAATGGRNGCVCVEWGTACSH